ncbi:5-hydroxytryptamine receptor 1A-like isoform X1 [Phlebotomus argentipes]|uniref:5-hydroxytryptamine receptor 1A-like isoform X1 n=1 Tax=Phlebotomus argentipes TaxID=94469 RepID=UPI0028931191|nr:5-hydroxytryptamine receptor 1A-like isoform X1 [Phlebotomus argentipes]XP_059611450.1 5-hydroxytryptamine receptor 1A-like isoform X1 [Phlebotomus argentipes]XP_059611451.1 5-hydroxytryptamine receptor 1A-like isoform X1 [Phlebotomus argentipes]
MGESIMPIFADRLRSADTLIYEIETTLGLDTDNSTAATSVSATLRLYDIFIPLLGVFIILLNLAVVISSGLILKRGQQPRSTYMFLGNVALSDLVTGIAVLFGQFYPREYRDEHSCAIQIGMIVSSTVTSVYSVGLIAIDRFLYILYGLQYQRWIYPNRTRILILFTWILGLIIGFLPAMGWRGDTDNGRVCWFIVLAPPELVLLTTILGLLPILLVVVLYSIILYHALRRVIALNKATQQHTGVQSGTLRMHVGASTQTLNEETLAAATTSDTEEPLQPRRRFLRFLSRRRAKSRTNVRQTTGKSPSKWKAIKVVLFTTGSFVFTWVPYFIASTMYVNCDPQATPEFCTSLRIAIASPLAILGFANSLLNPIIYAWWHNGFRETMKKICCGRCRKTSEEHGSSSSQRSRSTPATSPATAAPSATSHSGRANSGSDTDLAQHSPDDSDIESTPSTRAKTYVNPLPDISPSARSSSPATFMTKVSEGGMSNRGRNSVPNSLSYH